MAYTAIQGHGNIWAQVAAEGHVWVCCPTETRVYADVLGPYLPLGAMGELTPVTETLEGVSPTHHRPPQLPPLGQLAPVMWAQEIYLRPSLTLGELPLAYFAVCCNRNASLQ